MAHIDLSLTLLWIKLCMHETYRIIALVLNGVFCTCTLHDFARDIDGSMIESRVGGSFVRLDMVDQRFMAMNF